MATTTDEPLAAVIDRIDHALRMGTRFRRDDVRRLCDTATRTEDYERVVSAARTLASRLLFSPPNDAVAELNTALAPFEEDR